MITNNKFKLNFSSLSHLLAGSTRYRQSKSITIPRVVLLLDVSKWQGEINFVKMKSEGVDGVIVKCGQGTAKDLYFDHNWQKAKAAGLARGSYWFWDSRVNPTTQAANWWNWIKSDPGELKHYGDYEESYGGSFGGWQNFKTFMSAMVTSYRADKLGIYTGYYYWIANSPSPLTNSGSLNWFGQFELWEAWYTTNPANVLIPKPWTKLTLWQYGTMGMDGQTPNGFKYGAQSAEIDENNFDGDDAAYRAHYNLSGITPTDPGGEPMNDRYEGTIATVQPNGNPLNALSFRSSPQVNAANTSENFIKAYDAGTPITGSEIVLDTLGFESSPGVVRRWLKISSINNVAQVGYMAYDYLSVVDTQPQTGIVITSVTVNYTENGVAKSETLP